MTAFGQGIAVVFLDLDGTLVDRWNRFPASAADAIARLRRNGHLAVLNTGRPPSGIHPHILNIGFDGIIASCGAHVSFRGETLLNRLIDPDVLADILPALSAAGIDACLEGPRFICFECLPPQDSLRHDAWLYSDLPGVVRDWHDGPLEAAKINLRLRPGHRLPAVLPQLRRHFDVISHDPEPFAECILPGHSKAGGMRFLLDRPDLGQVRTVAFGDSLNDIGMLAAADIGIAMGGSRQPVQAVCRHVTDALECDGIAKALRHFGLA